jgi:hypothetical protein
MCSHCLVTTCYPPAIQQFVNKCELQPCKQLDKITALLQFVDRLATSLLRTPCWWVVRFLGVYWLWISVYITAYFETRTGLGPGLEENPDSRKTRTRTRKKSGLEKNPDSCLKKPGLDFWKPGLEIEKTGFKTRTLCTRLQRFFRARQLASVAQLVRARQLDSVAQWVRARQLSLCSSVG